MQVIFVILISFSHELCQTIIGYSYAFVQVVCQVVCQVVFVIGGPGVGKISNNNEQ